MYRVVIKIIDKHMTVSYLCKLLVSEKFCQRRCFLLCIHGNSSVTHGTACLLDSPPPPTFEAHRQKSLPVQLKSQTGGDSLKERETLDAIPAPITAALRAAATSRLGGESGSIRAALSNKY